MTTAKLELTTSPQITVQKAGWGHILGIIRHKEISDAFCNRLFVAALVMLVGLITKNGILIVEFANQLRRKGMERLEAIIEASSLRLRPILMTALATVLGAVPLALSSGAGAEARAAIGWVIVGGMSVGTLLTLFIIPVFYTLIVRNVHMIPEEREVAELAAGGSVVTSPQSRER